MILIYLLTFKTWHLFVSKSRTKIEIKKNKINKEKDFNEN